MSTRISRSGLEMISPLLVAIGQMPLIVGPVGAVGQFLDGEVVFVAGDEIERRRRLAMLSIGSTATLAPMKPILAVGLMARTMRRGLAVRLEAGRRGVDDDQLDAPSHRPRCP